MYESLKTESQWLLYRCLRECSESVYALGTCGDVSKVSWTREITVSKLLNVKVIMWWNLQHQSLQVSQPLITYVLKALTKELSAPQSLQHAGLC